MRSDILPLICDPSTRDVLELRTESDRAAVSMSFFSILRPASTFLFAMAFRSFSSKANCPARIKDIR